MITRDGTRQVEAISLDGHPVLRVTDPRTPHGKILAGYVPVTVEPDEDGTFLLDSVTAGRLEQLGVDLAELE